MTKTLLIYINTNQPVFAFSGSPLDAVSICLVSSNNNLLYLMRTGSASVNHATCFVYPQRQGSIAKTRDLCKIEHYSILLIYDLIYIRITITNHLHPHNSFTVFYKILTFSKIGSFMALYTQFVHASHVCVCMYVAIANSI